ALAGSLSFSSGFIVLVIVYTVLLIAALMFGHEAELRAESKGGLGRELPAPRRVATKRVARAPIARSIGALVATSLVATGVVFVFLPRLPGTSIAALPFALARRNPIPGFTGAVVNPGRRGGTGSRDSR